jgi:hypothetical protein
VDQTSATTAEADAPEASDDSKATDAGPDGPPGFRTRGRVRRRARYLRKARELAYRDLGGLLFDLHRFGQRNDELVEAKLSTLSRIDTELRTLERALGERQPLTVLREAGVTACPRCAAIHSGEDHFCPNCGLPMSRHVDLPIAAAAASAATPPTAPSGGGAPGGGASRPSSAPPARAAAPPPPAPAAAPTPPVARPGAPDERSSSDPAPSEPPVAPGEKESTEILRPPKPGA